MAKTRDIPVHKVRLRHPQTGEIGWTFRVQAHGTVDIEYVAKRIGRRLLVDPNIAAVIFGQIAEEIIYCVQDGITVDMGILGYVHPTIKNQGWAKEERDMTLRNTKGSISWELSKLTKQAFRNVGCTLDYVQRSRNHRKGVKDEDDENFEEGYPLELNEE